MDSQVKLTLALIQVENIRELLKDGPYYAFFTSHLLPVRFEIERQLTNLKQSSTIKE